MKSSRQHFHCILCAMFATAPGALARAQARPAAPAVIELSPARLAFDEGVRALDESRFATAAASFERSYQLAPAPVALFNLAFAYRGLGRLRDAISALDRFIAEPGNASPDRVAAARSELELLRAALGRVRVQVSPSDARVLIDGRESQRERGAFLLDPGPRVIEVALDGYVSVRRELRVVPGDNEEQRVQLALVDGAAHLRVEPSVATARIWIDGEFAGVGIVDRPVRAGVHRVEIRATDHGTIQRQVRVGGTGLVRVDASMVRTRINPWLWAGPTLSVLGAAALSAGWWALWETTLRPNEPLPTPVNAWGDPVQ